MFRRGSSGVDGGPGLFLSGGHTLVVNHDDGSETSVKYRSRMRSEHLGPKLQWSLSSMTPVPSATDVALGLLLLTTDS